MTGVESMAVRLLTLTLFCFRKDFTEERLKALYVSLGQNEQCAVFRRVGKTMIRATRFHLSTQSR